MSIESTDQQQSNELDLPKIDTLKNISKSFDIILDKPANEWGQKEINIYHLLQNTIEKYKVRYSLAQFKLDVRDIKRNVKRYPWYQNSKYQKTLRWVLDQLTIKSYQHSRESKHFRVTGRLSQAQIKLTIMKKDKFYYQLENESTNLKTMNLEDVDAMTQIFAINPKIDISYRTHVVQDLAQLIREIGMFYN